MKKETKIAEIQSQINNESEKDKKGIMELIDELCPDGVEYKKLYEVTIWNKKFNSVENFKQPSITKYPTLFAVDLFKLQQRKGNIFLLSTGERTGWTTEEKAGKNLCEGEVVAIPGGKSRPLKEVLKYYKGKFVTGDNRIATSIDEKILLTKYLYYFIQSNADNIDKMYRGATIQHPDMEAVLDMEIAIPPMEVQKKIIEILDSFSESTEGLQENLAKELELRKKQYEYYRDDLLRFPEGSVEYKKLYEVTIWDKKFKTVERFKQPQTKKYFTLLAVDLFKLDENKGNVFLLSTGERTGWTTEEKAGKNLCEGEVVAIPWGKSRPLKEVLKYYKGKFVTGDNRIATSIDEKILLTKYLYYFIQYNAENIDKMYRGPTIQHPDMEAVLNIKIAVPPIEKQKQIVEILEPLEKLTQSLTEGIPTEIEGRKKQYEYYRDMLLNFKRKED